MKNEQEKKDLYGLLLLLIRGCSEMDIQNELFPFLKNDLGIRDCDTFYSWTSGENRPRSNNKYVKGAQEVVQNRANLLHDKLAQQVKLKCDFERQEVIRQAITCLLAQSTNEEAKSISINIDIAEYITSVLAATHKSKLKSDLILIPIDQLRKLNIECFDRGSGKEFIYLSARNPLNTEPIISLGELHSWSNPLVGREEEIELLNDCWLSPDIRILGIIAEGGTGKTSLINEWLNRIEKNNYNGATIVYGWSFYSQGKVESKQISDKDFISDIEDFLKIPTNEKSSGNRERQIAHLLSDQQTILFLDGLEPLQRPPGDDMGKFKEAAISIRKFLREYIRICNGLCILTSRVPIKDLHNVPYYMEKELSNLLPESGAALLQQFDLKGNQEIFKEASKEYGGHPLALTLLGSYIANAFDGDIRKRDRIRELTRDSQYGGHAQRVVFAYEHWLKGKPELDILYLLGIFDRPAEETAIKKLFENTHISSVISCVSGTNSAEYCFAVSNLKSLRLISNLNGQIDTHPIIREYFEKRLRNSFPEEYLEANKQLYEHYKSSTAEFPETDLEMSPLYTAIVHGTRAGLYYQSFHEVYLERITRKGHYNLIKHGAYSADLAALANFFIEPWSDIVVQLDDDDRLNIFSRIVYSLLGVGRYNEAIEPIKKAIEMQLPEKKWKNLSISYGNLVELYCPIGDLDSANKCGEDAIKYSDLFNDKKLSSIERSIAAYGLFLAGKIEKAESLFKSAEDLQQNLYLSSVQGFRYCELFLWLGNCDEVIKRAKWCLKLPEEGNALVDIGLYQLMLGRAWFLKRNYEEAFIHLDDAVNKLRNAGQLECIISSLLARSEYFIIREKFEDAMFDIKEAELLANDNGLELLMLDSYFSYACLYIKQKNTENLRDIYNILYKKLQHIKYGSRLRDFETIKNFLDNNC